MEGGSIMDYRIEEREGFDVIVKAKKLKQKMATQVHRII